MVLEFLSALNPEDICSWPEDKFFVAPKTSDMADEKRQRLLNVRSREHGKTVISPIIIHVRDTAGKLLYGHFRKDRTGSADLAEHESIAWALTHPDEGWVFVTQDKNAASCALSELGRERKGVCDTHEFLNHLFDEELLSPPQLKTLMDCSNKKKKQDNKIPPIPWRYLDRYNTLCS